MARLGGLRRLHRAAALPAGRLDDFVDRVGRNCSVAASSGVKYEGKTLRENLGLPRPTNRFF